MCLEICTKLMGKNELIEKPMTMTNVNLVIILAQFFDEDLGSTKMVLWKRVQSNGVKYTLEKPIIAWRSHHDVIIWHKVS